MSTDIPRRAQARIWPSWHDRVFILNSNMVRCVSVYRRTMRTWQVQTLTVHCSWSALGGVLVTGVNAGGPPVMIWGWVGISCVSLCVAYSMAEMCSEYPVAGGQYSWVYILSPKSIRRQFSYLTGWFMIIGMLSQERRRLTSATTTFTD